MAQAPVNDLVVNATTLSFDTNGDYCSSGTPYTTAQATPDENRASNWQQGPNRNVWFKFTAVSTTVSITVRKGGISNAMIALYSGDNNQLTELASKGYPSNAWTTTGLVYESLVPGQLYYIAIDNYVGGSYQGGTFDLCVKSSLDYDHLAGALNLPLDANGDYCSSGTPFTTTWATADQSKPSNWQEGPNKNIWFKFTAKSATASITVRKGGISRAMIALYSYENGQLTELASKAYPANVWTTTGLVYESLNIDQEYYISVDSYVYSSYRGGSFDLCLKSSLDYDHLDGALTLPLDANGDYCSSGTPFTTTWATADQSKPSNWQEGPNKNIWFKFTAKSATASITVRKGGISRAMIALYSYENGQLTELASKAYPANVWTTTGLVYESLNIDQEYYISVDSYVYSSYRGGSFDLCLKSSLDYDHLDGALTLPLDANGDYCSSGTPYTTTWATADQSKPSNWQEGPNKNIWFKFTAKSATASITVRKGGISRAMIALYSYENGQLTELGSKAYPANVWTTTGLVYESLNIDQEYYISVDSYVYSSYRGGSFDLCLKSSLDYDHLDGALSLPLDANGDYCSSGLPYTTTWATADQSRPSNWQEGPNKNIWFKFTAKSTTASITVRKGGIGRAMIALYTYDNGQLTEVVSKGYPPSHWVNAGLVYESLIPEQEYYISIDSYVYSSYRGGSFDLCIKGAIDNDYRDGAKILPLDANGSYCSTPAEFANNYATPDGIAPSSWHPQHGKNVWFKFWVGQPGEADIQINAAGITRIMYALYDEQGAEITSSSFTGVFDSRQFTASGLVGGQYYYLEVDSYIYGGYQGGSFGLCVNLSSDFECTTELWAINSGAWDDPGTWSDTEGGQPVTAIPCATTIVYIKGFDVSFNSPGLASAKRVVMIGTHSDIVTRLDIQAGELVVKEEVVTAGPGVTLKAATGARVRVTGDE